MRMLTYVFLLVLLGYSNGLDFPTKVLLQLYDDCSKTDWLSCLKIKLLTSLDNLRNVQRIPVASGITFEDENFIPDLSRPVSEKLLEGSLPRTTEDRNELLNSLLQDKVWHFLSRYTLRWKLSNLRNPINEARGKKKYSHLLMMPLMMAASFVPIALGALAILAGKALIVGKMALLLTGILGIRNLFSNNAEDDDHQRAMKRIGDIGMRLKSELMAHRMGYKGNHQNDMMMMMGHQAKKNLTGETKSQILYEEEGHYLRDHTPTKEFPKHKKSKISPFQVE